MFCNMSSFSQVAISVAISSSKTMMIKIPFVQTVQQVDGMKTPGGGIKKKKSRYNWHITHTFFSTSPKVFIYLSQLDYEDLTF